jgi:hypothetical protein
MQRVAISWLSCRGGQLKHYSHIVTTTGMLRLALSLHIAYKCGSRGNSAQATSQIYLIRVKVSHLKVIALGHKEIDIVAYRYRSGRLETVIASYSMVLIKHERHASSLKRKPV